MHNMRQHTGYIEACTFGHVARKTDYLMAEQRDDSR